MKRNNLHFFVLFILVSSTFLGISAMTVRAASSQLRTSALVQAEDNSTMIVVVGGSEFKAWGPTTWQFSLGSSWMVGGQGGSPKGHTLEKLWEIRDIPDAPYFEYAPVLATGYSVVEYFPSEENSFEWNNTGGFRVINITLRENVKFHDGSEWNATVAKWNIDRAYVLTGNLTGSEGAGHSDIMGHMTYKPGIDYKDFFTPSWNYSYTYSNDPVNGTPQPPQYFGKDNDPNLSWTSVSKTYLKDGSFSIFNKTLVVKSADETASGTGGTIQIELNDHFSDLRLLSWFPMISMEQYNDMFYTQIKDTFDWTGDQLACGTGTYKAIEVDKVNQSMKLERFDDYWNFTAMRDDSFMIVKDAFVQYYPGDTNGQLVTIAMTAGDADFALDGPYGELFDDQLKASPLLNYTETGPADSIEQLDFIIPNTDMSFRKAISFAFNYTQYLVSVKEGKAIRCDNLLGENSVYINHSIIGSYQNLTIARSALLNNQKYVSVLNFAGIDGNSTTQDWNDFADDVHTLNATSEELFTFNYLHDIFNVDFTSILETSLADIGIVLNKSGATPSNLYGDWKMMDFWGKWYPLLIERQAWYAKDMEGFYVDWPTSIKDLSNLDAFYTYKSVYMDVSGTMQWTSVPDIWNWGLINDPVLQENIRALHIQDEEDKLKSYNTIQKRVGTEIYTTMFVSQDTQGYAVNKKFIVDWFWGEFSFAYVGAGEFFFWDQVPTDQIIEYGTAFGYDVNASASSGIDQYWVNDTINFQIDDNGIITNATFLSIGEYWLEIVANNTLGSNITTTIKITVQIFPFKVELSQPEDRIYFEGDTGNEILWQITCSNISNPHYYIYRNDSLIRDDSWQLEDSILVNVDGLSVGTYEYKIDVVNDGKTVSDTVLVIVNAKPSGNGISGYNLTFLIGVIGIIGSITCFYLKRKIFNSKS